MRTPQPIWHYCQQHRIASIVIGHVSVVAVLGAILLSNIMGLNVFGAFAKSPCSRGDQTYVVVRGYTLSKIAARYKTTWQHLSSYNHIVNPNLIYVRQVVCIPQQQKGNKSHAPIKGKGNFFPYGQCTWWASQRYYQLHGVYVPWITQANAWQWAARAKQFHWQVSSKPAVGDIIDLQPWVQGAYGLGHVAVVERVLSNGHVITSTMNWGAYPRRIIHVEFAPGPGVSFIRI
jgi:N-acetylmuramoyl-L-alanine amidase